MTVSLSLLALWLPALAAEVPETPVKPIPSYGESCPAGWRGGADQCFPVTGARPVIRRSGLCPDGWAPTAGWCQREPGGQDAVPMVPPAGCAPGWRASGAYCVR